MSSFAFFYLGFASYAQPYRISYDTAAANFDVPADAFDVVDYTERYSRGGNLDVDTIFSDFTFSACGRLQTWYKPSLSFPGVQFSGCDTSGRINQVSILGQPIKLASADSSVVLHYRTDTSIVFQFRYIQYGDFCANVRDQSMSLQIEISQLGNVIFRLQDLYFEPCNDWVLGRGFDIGQGATTGIRSRVVLPGVFRQCSFGRPRPNIYHSLCTNDTITSYRYPVDQNLNVYFVNENPISSTESAAGLTNLTFFPNPATDLVTIQFEALPQTSDARTCHIIDATGRFVLSQRLPAGVERAELDVADLPPGLYTAVLDRARARFVKL